jgi:hypothetical protein
MPQQQEALAQLAARRDALTERLQTLMTLSEKVRLPCTCVRQLGPG